MYCAENNMGTVRYFYGSHSVQVLRTYVNRYLLFEWVDLPAESEAVQRRSEVNRHQLGQTSVHNLEDMISPPKTSISQ